jgi:hypothetical protein
VLSWRTAPGRDAQALASALGSYVARGLGGRPGAGSRTVWTLPGSAAALSSQGSLTVLALAPTAITAQTLAARAATVPPVSSRG